MGRIILEVWNKDKRFLGKLNCARGSFEFSGPADEKFMGFVGESLKSGIPSFSDEYSTAEDKSVICVKSLSKKDVEPQNLKDFLRGYGCVVREKYPEVEEEISKLLEEVSDDDPDKKLLLSKLPEMSHLEQTAVLEKLRGLDKEGV